MVGLPRDDAEWQTVEVLETMQGHGAVHLVQDVLAERHAKVRPDTEDVPIAGGMVQLAQGHAVRDHGLATVGITDAVGSLHQLGAPQAADRTGGVVGPHHRFTEAGLVHPALHEITRLLVRDGPVTALILKGRFDQVDLPLLEGMHRGLGSLEKRRESLIGSVEELRQRLAAETAARSVVTRFRRRRTIEELEVRLEEMSATLAEVTQRIGSAHASLVGLPDQRELSWMLDRRFAIDTQPRHAASMRVRAFRSEPPPYLRNARGPPPTDSWSLRRWERTAVDIETHRFRWQIADRRNALGSEVGGRRMERSCSHLRDEIERTARELAPRHVRQRSLVRGR